MIQPPPFPVSIDALDIETLTTALGGAVGSFTSERIGADRGMLGEIFLVRPTYLPGSAGPEVVVCKFAALREEALASARRGGANERELRCYDELLGSANVSTPAYYGAWYEPETARFLLVQEAVAVDAAIDQIGGVDPGLVGLVTSQVAQLHHVWWQHERLPDLQWLPRLDDPRRITNLTTLATNGWQPLCDLVDDEFTAAERALGAAFPERLEAALHSLAAMPSTLIHGDLRADNLLFSPEHDRVSLIDWQGAGVGPGSFDVAYLLSHTLTVADRQRHAPALIDRYLADLSAAGTLQSKADFMAGFALSLHFGLAVACALPLIADPSEARVKQLATTMARRSIEALRDYDQLW